MSYFIGPKRSIHQSIAFTDHLAHSFPRGNFSLLETEDEDSMDAIDHSIKKARSRTNEETVASFIVPSIHRSRSPTTSLTTFQRGNSSLLETVKETAGRRNRLIERATRTPNDTRKRSDIPSMDRSRSPTTPLTAFQRGNSSLLQTDNEELEGRDRALDP